MRRTTASVIDNKTRCYLIYSECSYNEACYQLTKDLHLDLEKENIETKSDGDLTHIYVKGRHFIYDETRGLLLEKE